MPQFWPLPRKEKVWVVRPVPGPHNRQHSIPLLVIVRDVLKYAATANEAKHIITTGNILVDGRVRKEVKFPVGLMDIIHIPKTNEHFRMMLAGKKLLPEKISQRDASSKLCKIIAKRIIKGGRLQLTLHDGRTILIDKKPYRPGDTLVLSLSDQKILNHFSLEQGAGVVIVSGRNMGISGTIKDIRERKNMLEKSTVTLETKGRDIVTPRGYVFVVSGSAQHSTQKKKTAASETDRAKHEEKRA